MEGSTICSKPTVPGRDAEPIAGLISSGKGNASFLGVIEVWLVVRKKTQMARENGEQDVHSSTHPSVHPSSL